MKSLKIMLGISMAVVGASSVGVVAAFNKGNSLFETQAAQSVVDFSSDTITRRVWVVNADDWGWSNYYAHFWLASDNTVADDVQITNWVNFSGTDMYYSGLAYFDITFAGAGDSIGVIIKNTSDWSGTQTGDNYLPALSSDSADVIFLNAGHTDGKRNSEVKAAGMSTGQAAKMLDTISTCYGKQAVDFSASFANGYNAYPQLNKDFFIPSSGQIDLYGDQTYVSDKDAEENNYTLNQKIAELEYMYNNYGWKTE